MRKPINADYSGEWYYNWKDDIQEVPDYEDDIWYDVAENMVASNQKEYEDYDVWDVLSSIISLWKIEKRSRLYDYLLKWYGSEAELLNNVRDVYNTRDAIYFVTGTGYSIWSADLLGGSANGAAEREFDRFVDNGGKRIESAKSIKASSRPTKPATSWEELPSGKDAVFLPKSNIENVVTIIYVNENANDGNGSFEIEYIDAEGILEAYDEMIEKGLTADVVLTEIFPDMYQGKWYYCDNNPKYPEMKEQFDEYVREFYNADFIEGIDGDYDDELELLVDWAKTKV